MCGPMHVVADSAVGLDAHVRVAHAWGTSCWACSGLGLDGLGWQLAPVSWP